MKQQLFKFLMSGSCVLVSIAALAEQNVPAGEYRSTERTCGRARVTATPNQYPGLNVTVYDVPARNPKTYDFPRLGSLPAKRGYNYRTVDMYNDRGAYIPWERRFQYESGFCIRNVDEIASRDPSDYGVIDSSSICHYPQEGVITVSPSPRGEWVCTYKLVE